ncbi:hypothetical protein [Lysinibacter cavernae]|uniref:Uncharacterized protein n=1 Tax=Lysinibacter cavernae TaxID=1640652 RepID=A0A7X5R3J7_9MICO|nr:hypothetical protein [Lysinibacter cavernae]NIH54911.1 hypothetical protein [Lysinibacter cavernae]
MLFSSGIALGGVLFCVVAGFALVAGGKLTALFLVLPGCALIMAGIVLGAALPTFIAAARARKDISILRLNMPQANMYWSLIPRHVRNRLVQQLPEETVGLRPYLEKHLYFILMIDNRGVWLFDQREVEIVGELVIPRGQIREIQNSYTRLFSLIIPALVIQTTQGPIAFSPHRLELWLPTMYQTSELRTLYKNLNVIVMDDPMSASPEPAKWQ